MSCDRPEVPQYLHWNNRPVFGDADFLEDHQLYRVTLDGNPIEFPQGTITAYSCKWSLLINEEDILIVDDPPLGNSFKYALVRTIRDYELKRQKVDGNNLGWHKLTCTFNHDPKDCDYSHAEILIKHEVFVEENDEQTLIDQFVYTHQIWQQKTALLQGGGSFYKQLRNDYRLDCIKIFCNPI